MGFATRRVPAEAPAMINNSAGCSKTVICPFSIKNPPMTAANTMTMPMIANTAASPGQA
jgi:hypothetical protein